MSVVSVGGIGDVGAIANVGHSGNGGGVVDDLADGEHDQAANANDVGESGDVE